MRQIRLRGNQFEVIIAGKFHLRRFHPRRIELRIRPHVVLHNERARALLFERLRVLLRWRRRLICLRHAALIFRRLHRARATHGGGSRL